MNEKKIGFFYLPQYIQKNSLEKMDVSETREGGWPAWAKWLLAVIIVIVILLILIFWWGRESYRRWYWYRYRYPWWRRRRYMYGYGPWWWRYRYGYVPYYW